MKGGKYDSELGRLCVYLGDCCLALLGAMEPTDHAMVRLQYYIQRDKSMSSKMRGKSIVIFRSFWL